MHTQEFFSSYYKNGQSRTREKNGFWVEDSNHLGNVLEVISDRKLQVDGETIISYKEDFSGSTTGDFIAGAGTTLSNETDALKIENTSSSLTTELILSTAIGEEYTLDLNLLERNGIGVFVEISQTTGSITEELVVGSNTVTIVGTADDRITGFTLIGVPDPLTPTIVIDDVKLSKIVGDDGIVDYHIADVVTQSDYYPFGMLLPNRNEDEASDYRYSFQGQEKDDEIKGENNSVNYKFRMHDPRVGRFFAVDPLAAKYPHNSPYAFSENEVIAYVELEGLERGGARYGVSPTQVYHNNRASTRYTNYQRIRTQSRNTVTNYNRTTNSNQQFHKNGQQPPGAGAAIGARATNLRNGSGGANGNPELRYETSEAEEQLIIDRENQVKDGKALAKVISEFDGALKAVDAFQGGFVVKTIEKYKNTEQQSFMGGIVFDDPSDKLIYEQQWTEYNQKVDEFNKQFREKVPPPLEINPDGSKNSKYGQELSLWTAIYKITFNEEVGSSPFKKILDEVESIDDGSIKKETWSIPDDIIYETPNPGR